MDAECCDDVTAVDGWQVGVAAASDPEAFTVREALMSLRPLDLPISATLARLSREDLPPCSILLADGRSVAALAWGPPLGLIEIDHWEHAITSGPATGGEWKPLAPGTLIDLADCGPTIFTLPYPHPTKEYA